MVYLYSSYIEKTVDFVKNFTTTCKNSHFSVIIFVFPCKLLMLTSKLQTRSQFSIHNLKT